MATGEGEMAGLLLGQADRLLRTAVRGTRGLWPRSVTFLIRLALEQALGEFWKPRVPAMTGCSMRAQLVCLRTYAGAALADRVSSMWGAVSGACHYHSYELAPTAGELRSWHAEVGEIVGALTASPPLEAPNNSAGAPVGL